jgi:uncharacterized protein YbjT (DUF2867 family)
MKILVTGATGYVGGRLVPRLLELGHDIHCFARDPSHLAGRGWEGVTVHRGDALDAGSFLPVMAGVDVAYYLIHSMAQPEGRFEDHDRFAAEHFGMAASAAGVKRIIYLGGLGKADEVLSPHLASRHEVGEILRSSGVPVTEFRAAVIVGSGSISFEIIRYLTEGLPAMFTPRWMSTRCQPISIADVLDYLVQALREPASVGRVLEIGGPDVLTYREMILGYAAQRGLRRVLVPIPLLTPHLSSLFLHWFTPIPASISRALIDGMRNEVVVHDHAAEEIFTVPHVPYQEAVRRALIRVQSGSAETYWSGAVPGLRPGTALAVTEGMIIDDRRVESAASASAVFATFAGIGGQRGWFYGDWGWRLRGAIDRAVGGVGLRRGRRSPNELRTGDALDFWRVEEVIAGRLVRLRAEMKLPGRAWLQFEVTDLPAGGSLLVQRAFFEPHGLFGLLYWYSLYTIHQFFFAGMSRAIARRAELAQASSASP